MIPSAMVNLVRGVRAPAGSIPSEAATCLEAVARWRGAEVKTRGNRVSPPGWNFVAADLCDLCVDLSSVDDWDSDDWDSSRYDRVCVRLNALGGVARGLASVSVEATDFEKIGSAISVAIVNLEKVITAVTAASRHEATRVGDARTAGWTAAAALLSVPIGKGGGPEKSESLSALASAATVRLLDDALEGLPAVSQNANPGSADEPSHRLLAGLRAVHRLVEVVVPMYPGEPESGLGRKIALAVEKSVKSSRFRKNAPAWAAATACVLHPRLFGSSPRMHSRLAGRFIFVRDRRRRRVRVVRRRGGEIRGQKWWVTNFESRVTRSIGQARSLAGARASLRARGLGAGFVGRGRVHSRGAIGDGAALARKGGGCGGVNIEWR